MVPVLPRVYVLVSDICNDYGGNPACLKDADPSQRMDFTDIGEGYIHWCANCGPAAHAQMAAINEAFEAKPGFREEFKSAIEAAEAAQRKTAS